MSSIISEILFDRTTRASKYWLEGRAAPEFELLCGAETFDRICEDPSASQMLDFTPEGVCTVGSVPITVNHDQKGWTLRPVGDPEHTRSLNIDTVTIEPVLN